MCILISYIVLCIILENDNFDMVPELDEISLDPEFSLMGIEGVTKQIRHYMSSMISATLTISGTRLTVSTISPYTVDNGESEEGAINLEYKSATLFEAAVIQVLCCSQVSGRGLWWVWFTIDTQCILNICFSFI